MTDQIVEINGLKIIIDVDKAKRVDTFRIGDKVKLWTKDTYNTNKVYPGVVVAFENFRELPTIVIAYIENSYGTTALKFAYINSGNTNTDIVKAVDNVVDIDKKSVLHHFNSEITKKQQELDDLKCKKQYFLDNFKRYFSVEGESDAS